MKKATLLLISFFLLTGHLFAQNISDERRVDWTIAGLEIDVPCGSDSIDITQPPYNADNTGSQDVTNILQSAIDDAEDNQIIFLPAGTYSITNTIVVPSYRTIKGVSPTETIIEFNLGKRTNGSNYCH